MLFRSILLVVLVGALALSASPRLAAAEYSWRNVVIGGGGYVTGIEFHPAVEGLAYARTDVGGAYRRNTAGGRWIALNDSIGGLDNGFMQLGVLSLALDRSDPGRVHLACGQYTDWWAPNARFMSSEDRGTTWTNRELPFKLGGNEWGRGTGERLAVDPRDGTRLFLGTTDDGLWHSTDRGLSWQRVAGFPPSSVTFVRFDPATPDLLFAGAVPAGGSTLWKSVDGGVTWDSVPGEPKGMIALQSSFGAAGELYVACCDSISLDRVKAGVVGRVGADGSWVSLKLPGGQGGFATVAACPGKPGRLLVSTLARWWPNDEVYRSDDGGESWVALLDGAKLDQTSAPWSRSLEPHWISDVEIDPFNPDHALFVTGFGIFSTNHLSASDGPPSWSFDNEGLEETVPLALVSPASGPSLVSAIMDFDGFRHDDPDVSPSKGRHAPHHGSTQSLDGAGVAPEVMARLHGATGSISRDGGLTWMDFPTAPPSPAGGQIAVSADGTRLLWCPKEGGPAYSADDGATWKPSAGELGTGLWPAADRVNPRHFWVFDHQTRQVHVSRDGGATFKLTNDALPGGGRRIETVPGHTDHLWHAAGEGGLWRSSDGGAGFHQERSVERAYHVGFGRPAPGETVPAIYLWGRIDGEDGIFRSDDRGRQWQRINDEKQQFGFINDITGDARVFGRVYLGTSGRGVILGEPAGGR